jgi:phosphate transport system substrate-binding protein
MVVAGLLIPLSPSAAADQTVTGAGSSAAAPVFQVWAREFQKSSGSRVSYDPAGSSGGLKKIRAREVDFGASDVAPPAAELTAEGLVVFPIAITGIAPVFNLPKMGDASLRLTGGVLARIFLGEIRQWNAPEITQLNPGFRLPAIPITVVVRSDGSGTTYNFADYLAKISVTWKEKNGVKTTIAWPEDFLGVKGSEGVVKAVKGTIGAIGYVDFGYIADNNLSTIQLKNSEGEFVKPSNASFRSALGSSDWVSNGTFNTTLTNASGKGSWPITMGTYIVMPLVTENPEQSQRTLKFFVWAFVNGDRLVQESNFVRLPDRVQSSAFKAISSIKDKAGNRIAIAILAAAVNPVH